MAVYFKLFGLRYNDPHGQPRFNDKNYLASLQFARTGDVLVDNDGNEISFGVVGVPYAVEPNPAGMTPEETGLWFNLATNSVWSRTKLSDGVTIVDKDMGFNPAAYMLKSVYDTNDDGIVDAADQLLYGTTSVTATEARNHIDDEAIHTPLNDAVTTDANVWSAQKVMATISGVLGGPYATAGETIFGSRVVRLGSDGKAYLVNSANIADAAGIVGLSATAAATDTTFRVAQVGGPFTDPAWTWTPGLPVYVNGDKGQLSHTPPTSGFSRRVGVAATSTTILVQFGDTIVLL